MYLIGQGVVNCKTEIKFELGWVLGKPKSEHEDAGEGNTVLMFFLFNFLPGFVVEQAFGLLGRKCFTQGCYCLLLRKQHSVHKEHLIPATVQVHLA